MTIQSYGVKAQISRALSLATPKSNTLASLAAFVPSDLGEGQSENHILLGAPPPMIEWAEKRQKRQPPQYELAIMNKLYETSVGWPCSWQRHDKTGEIQRQIKQMQARYLQLAGKLVADLINNGGTSTKTLDGVAYFSSSHSYGESGTIDNLIGTNIGTTTAPTAYEAAQIIEDIYEALLGFKDDVGEPVNEDMTDLTIVCRHTMAGAFQNAIENDTVDTGSGSVDNPVTGLKKAGINFHLIPSARISATATSYGFNTTPGISAPFVFQESVGERRVTFKDDEHDNNRYEYGIKAVCGAGYGHFVHGVSNVHT